MAGEYELYKGYILAPGVQMPIYDIYETDIFSSVEGFRQGDSIHSSDSDSEAKAWIDDMMPEGPVTEAHMMELRLGVQERIPEVPFTPFPPIRGPYLSTVVLDMEPYEEMYYILAYDEKGNLVDCDGHKYPEAVRLMKERMSGKFPFPLTFRAVRIQKFGVH